MFANQLKSQLIDYQTVLFDLDDTVFPQRDYDRGAFEDIAINFKNKTGLANYLLELKSLKGNHYPYLFNDAANYFGLPSSSVKKMLKLYKEHTGRHIETRNSLRELIEYLYKSSINTFIITNGHEIVQRTKIERLKLNPLLTGSVICTKANPEKLKPNPWAYEQISSRYNVLNAVMVGDSVEIDGKFAINSGIKFIHYTFPGAEK